MPIIESLVSDLGDEHYWVRRDAATALGKLKDVRAIQLLTAALRDPNEDVRVAAVRALGSVKDPAVVEPLLSALEDSSPEVRRSAVWSLQKAKDPRAIQPLIDALDRVRDVHGMSRSELEVIAEALGEIGDSRSSAPLLAAFVVHKNCYKALERLQERGVLATVFPPDLNYYDDTKALPIALDELQNRRAVADLCWALSRCSHYQEAEVNGIIRCLSQINDPSCVPAVMKIGGKASLELLARFKDPRSRVAVARSGYSSRGWAWEELKSRQMIAELSELLNSAFPTRTDVRVGAADTLGHLLDNPSAVEALFVGITRKDGPGLGTQTYDACRRALKRCNSASATGVAIRALSNPEGPRSVAAEVLGQIKDVDGLTPLLNALNDPNQFLREGVIRALAEVGSPLAIEPLLRCYRTYFTCPGKYIGTNPEEYIGTSDDVEFTMFEACSAVNKIAACSLVDVSDEVLHELLDLKDRTLRWGDQDGGGSGGLCFAQAREAAGRELGRRGAAPGACPAQ